MRNSRASAVVARRGVATQRQSRGAVATGFVQHNSSHKKTTYCRLMTIVQIGPGRYRSSVLTLNGSASFVSDYTLLAIFVMMQFEA